MKAHSNVRQLVPRKQEPVYPSEVSVQLVRPDPKQPRTYFEETALKALARSIKRKGQYTAIIVRPVSEDGFEGYEIIDGERRWRACQLAEVSLIKIQVEDIQGEHADRHLVSLVTNFHKADHTHMEISHALAYQRASGKTVAELVDTLGKSEGWVYQYLSLQNLCEALRQKLHPDTCERELLRFNEALVLASIPAEKQEPTYQELLGVSPKMRLHRVREMAEEITGVKRRGRKPSKSSEILVRFIDRLEADALHILDMSQKEFVAITDGMTGEEIKVLIKKVHDAKGQLNVCLRALEEGLEKKTVRLR